MAIASGYIKLLERSCRRWQLLSCSEVFTRITTFSTCTLGFDTVGDNEIDHIYDPDTDTIIEKQGFFSVNANTIGLILLFFVALTLIVLFILRKRRKVKKNTKIL